MIEFHCWYCNRRHTAPKGRVGERITCGCQYPLRVPKRSGGACRIKTGLDRFVEAAVYGGGGGLLGFALGFVLLSFGGDYLPLLSIPILARSSTLLLFLTTPYVRPGGIGMV